MPTSRYVTYEGRGLLHVASYEVALTLAQLLIKLIHSNDLQSSEVLLQPLNKAFGLVKSNYVETEKYAGWANDHTRRTGLIESWTNAIVLLFMIYYRDALMTLRQQIILERYHAIKCKGCDQILVWSDMIPAFRDSSWIAETGLKEISDPTNNGLLTNSVENKIILPISKDWVHRPPKRTRTPSCASSVILYGPPGTRKTSLS